MTREEFLQKFSKQDVFLKNENENAVVKFTPEGKQYVKFKGEQPFEAAKGSAIVSDVRFEEYEITEEAYNNF